MLDAPYILVCVHAVVNTDLMPVVLKVDKGNDMILTSSNQTVVVWKMSFKREEWQSGSLQFIGSSAAVA